MIVRLLILIVMGLLMMPAMGMTQSATEKLIEGIQAHNELEWEDAVTHLNDALQLGLPEASQIEAYKYLGFAYLNLDNLSNAQGAFESILQLDPNYELDATLPPKYRSFFDLVKSGFKPTEKPIEVQHGTIDAKSEPPSAQIALDGILQKERTPTKIEKVPVGDHSLKLTLGGYRDWQRNIRVDAGKTTDVNAQLEKALGGGPQTNPNAPAKKGSSLKWYAIGGVVVAAGVGIAIMLLSGDDDGDDEDYTDDDDDDDDDF